MKMWYDLTKGAQPVNAEVGLAASPPKSEPPCLEYFCSPL